MSNNPADTDRLDSDPTDELPILLETAVLDPAEHRVSTVVAVPGDEETGEHTLNFPLHVEKESLARSSLDALHSDLEARDVRIAALERDLGRLSSRWIDVERQVAEKDATITELNAATAEANATIATQRQLLEERGVAEQRLATEIADRDAQFNRVLDELEQARREAETQRGALAAEAAGHRATAAELAALRALEQQQTAAGIAPDERQRLREEIASLAAYIGNRGTWWNDLEAQAAAATARVAELERELEHRSVRQRRAEELAARESGRATELRTELVAQARRFESLERELRGTRAGAAAAVVDGLRAELDGAVATAGELRLELEDAERRLAEATRRETALLEAHSTALGDARAAAAAETQAARDAAFAAGHAAGYAAAPTPPAISQPAPDASTEIVAQLEADLAHLRAQAAEQRSSLEDQAEHLRGATAELDQLRRQIAEARALLEQNRADHARLERALADKDRALQARDERVRTLQAELDDKLGALQRLSTLDATVQGLDSRMRLHRGDSARETSPSLVCLTSEQPRHYPLSKKTITIGRSSQCDIQIVTHFVSREHARLTIGRHSVVIEDLGSTNGVFVNSVRIDKHELRHSDLVTVGETQFRFLGTVAH
jgi:chromosome segregation ATPase